jgi:hypothetical protein
MTMVFDKCPLTGEPAEIISKDNSIIRYRISVASRNFNIELCEKCLNHRSELLNNRHHIVLGLLLNNKLPGLTDSLVHLGPHDATGNFDLVEKLKQATYPKYPKEKLDYLFAELYKLQKYDGQTIEIDPEILQPSTWKKWYFKSDKEFYLYYDTLVKKNLLTVFPPEWSGDSSKFELTFEGLTYYIQTFEEGFNSKSCFVAMAFQDETRPIRDAIKKALKKTGFDAVIVDEQNIESDRTINDEILAGIKKSKFCVADFTYQKRGVYFESGFGLGLGKPVIYCCERKDFENAHFDIKPLQHIIYDTPDELERKLTSKIEAWIL